MNISTGHEELILILDHAKSIRFRSVYLEVCVGLVRITAQHTYSGLLRSINIATFEEAADASSSFAVLRQILGGGGGRQIHRSAILVDPILLSDLLSAGILLFHRPRRRDPIIHITDVSSVGSSFTPTSPSFHLVIGSAELIFDGTHLYVKENVCLDTPRRVLPSPVLRIEKTKTGFSAQVFFDYEGEEVAAHAVTGEHQRPLRDLFFEHDALEVLTRTRWRFERENLFSTTREEFYRACSEAQAIGFRLLLYNRPLRPYSSGVITIRMGERIEWFAGESESSPERKTLISLISLLANHQDYIQIDDEYLLFPQSAQRLKRAVHQDGTLSVPFTRAGDLLDFYEEVEAEHKELSVFKPRYPTVSLNLSPSFCATLRPYQREGVKWIKYLYCNALGGCLADEMGLGKTIETIAFLSDRDRVSTMPTLIVVPKTLLYNWQREIAKFYPDAHVHLHHGPNRKSLDQCPPSSLVLTTYGTVDNDLPQLSLIPWDCIVLDEAQYIKNPRSRHHRSVKKLNYRFALALTGTPIENSLSDLWSVYHIVLPPLLGPRAHFLKRTKTPTSQETLHTLLSPFLLRRTKQDVLTELPEKVITVHYSQMHEEQQQLYSTVLEAIRMQLDSEERLQNSGTVVLNGLLHLRQICCHPALLPKGIRHYSHPSSGKFDQFCALLSSLISNHYKVVVFCQFTSMLALMQRWIENHSIPHWYLDGETEHRQAVVDGFESSAAGVFLISLKAGGVGINLTSAHQVIIYDPWWNPAVENQAIDRLHRIGQKNIVNVHKLIAIDSIEEKILELQQSKQQLFDTILTDQDSPLTFEEIRSLL